MTNPDDALWLLLVSLIVFASWMPHLVFSVLRWRQERTFRAFRGLFVAGMIQLALLRGVTGSVGRVRPDIEWIAWASAVFGVVALILLLSGGVVLAVTWVLEGRRRRA